VTTRPPSGADASAGTGAGGANDALRRSASTPKAADLQGGKSLPDAAKTNKAAVARETSKAAPSQITTKKAASTTSTTAGPNVRSTNKSVPELREALAARGLPTKGLKVELVARLIQAHEET